MDPLTDTGALRSVKTIISHASCSDGIASAMICSAALDWKPDVKFMHYGSSELQALTAEPGLLFVDFSPPKERAKEFLDAGALVLDHHRGAETVVRQFVDAGRGAFADEEKDLGVSGAGLAYSEVWQNMFDDKDWRVNTKASEIEQFASLIGIYDTFQRKDSRWRTAYAVYKMVRFLGFKYFSDRKMAYPGTYEHELSGILLAKHEATVARHCEQKVVKRSVNRIRVAFHNDTEGLNSDVAETMRQDPHHCPVTIGFFYVAEGAHPKMVMSVRSDGSFNVEKFCKYYGGGGHSAAGGFSQTIGNPGGRFNRPIERFPFDGEQNPWFYAKTLLERYLESEEYDGQ